MTLEVRLRETLRLASLMTLAVLALFLVPATTGPLPVALADEPVVPATCPLDAQDQVQSGHAWNVATAQLTIANCKAHPVAVVRRISSGIWDKQCSVSAQDLSTGTTWTGCPSPPACNTEQERLKRASGQLRLAAWKKKCAGKKVTLPPDEDPICTVPLQPVHTIVVHQTETGQAFGPDELQRAHLDRGFDDIGYHYVIARTRKGWRIFEGRTENVEGAHAGSGLNGSAIGIAIAGDYRAQSNPGKDPSTLVPPPEAVMLMKSLVSDIVARHSGIIGIYGHGEYKLKGSGCDTDCPSVGVQRLVDALRKQMF